MGHVRCAIIVLALSACVGMRAESAPLDSTAKFEKTIRPLLAKHCWSCHGAEKQKGELRLDSLADMRKGGESGPAVVPGQPDRSPIVLAVRHSEQLKMPPKNKLSEAEIASLTEWVKDGAVWPDAKSTTPPESKSIGPRSFTIEEKAFWAFQPIHSTNRAAIPGSNRIDEFLNRRREQAKLKSAPEADRRTLIRRVTWDLTGLPTTATELEAFIADTSPNAWDTLIDRLLASPAYGEKWGRRWLDVARYADSNGMDENLAHSHAWQYRDYVIRSFNSDKPFDQFAMEQIAGDLMPGGTEREKADRLMATGLLVIGPKMLAEDDPAKMRMDIVDEQLDTLGQAFLGLTFGCARCHDHKFDPITTHDYYGLAGIFYSTKTMQNYSVVAKWHERPIGTPENIALLVEFEKKRTAAADALRIAERKWREEWKAITEIERKRTDVYVAAARQFVARNRPIPLLVADPAKAKLAGSIMVEAEDYTRGNVLKLKKGYGEGIGVILNAGILPNVAEYDVEVPADGKYQVAIRYAAADTRPTILSIGTKRVRTDAASAATGSWNPDKQIWSAEAVVPLVRGKTTIRLERDGPFPHFDKIALLPLTLERAKTLAPTVEEIAIAQKLNLSLLRGWIALAAKWKETPPSTEELSRIAADPNGPFPTLPNLDGEPTALMMFAKAAKEQLATIEKTKPEIVEVMAVEENTPENLRIHLRGNHMTLGAEVPRRTLTILPLEGQPAIVAGSGRKEFANWLVNPLNPLTPRVIANRIWLGHFGKGLVRTPDNFGKLGERPTHPELLDYLASELINSGWSLKSLHRLILTSHAYKMSTRYDPDADAIDPDNRLLWRFHRRRLDAEEQRDGMLAIAGLLDRKAGGSLLTIPNRQYVTNTTNRAHNDYVTTRRTVYLPIIRSAIYDVLQANDFPDPSTPAGVRSITTIPAQALFLLNSDLADETSRAFARILIEMPLDDRSRIQQAYLRAYGRTASDADVTRALRYLATTQGVKPSADTTLLAWSGFCRVLLASAEFAFVE